MPVPGLYIAFLVVLGPLIFRAALVFAPGLAPLGDLYTVTRLTLATLMMLIAQLLAHLWLPAARLRLRDVWPGVAVTFLCSLGFGEGFGLFLSEYARNYVNTYAGLAYVMIALVFLYFIAAIFVFGGELNAAILRGKRPR